MDYVLVQGEAFAGQRTVGDQFKIEQILII